MNKWIKPNELPDDFWGECFVATYKPLNDKVYLHEGLSMVKMTSVGALFYADFDEESGWLEFRKDSDEHRTLVMPVMKPIIGKENFKWMKESDLVAYLREELAEANGKIAEQEEVIRTLSSFSLFVIKCTRENGEYAPASTQEPREIEAAIKDYYQ